MSHHTQYSESNEKKLKFYFRIENSLQNNALIYLPLLLMFQLTCNVIYTKVLDN
jgi:hypothetical protein